ncbi:hypothetical protein SD77_2475 [Bacillus badius]|uniref:Uncharacterized protein n=1 Tax=Bacillus badius TaxID=1455 RepID=A0ABR5AZ87_BACBA|nr:hypothetical protein SD78_2066 [Bacillus badius]KIL80021.1 hypothetical protein SD77_2475 [Bacillus badius]
MNGKLHLSSVGWQISAYMEYAVKGPFGRLLRRAEECAFHEKINK